MKYRMCMIFLIATLLLLPFISQVKAQGSTLIGVYWDSGCTNPVTNIEWGQLTPGEWYRKTLYLKNEQVEWPYLGAVFLFENPSDPNLFKTIYLEVTPHDSPVLAPEEILEINLCLFVYWENPSNIWQFSFDIEVWSDVVSDVNEDTIVDGVDYELICKQAYETYEPYRPWDIDRDGEGDLDDVYRVVIDYDCNYTKPDWAPYVPSDINEDLEVDMDDLYEVVMHYEDAPYPVGYRRTDVDNDKEIDLDDQYICRMDQGFDY